LPTAAEILIQLTTPGFLNLPVSTILDVQVDDLCAGLSAPAGNDAGYKCNAAGLYNFATTVQLWGSPTSWYADLHGFSYGVSIKIIDPEDEVDQDYSTCTLSIHANSSSNSNTSNTSEAMFVGISMVGVVGLVAAMSMRRRRAMIQLEADEEGTTTHFEMIIDPIV
jgi:hypothetical protein